MADPRRGRAHVGHPASDEQRLKEKGEVGLGRSGGRGPGGGWGLLFSFVCFGFSFSFFFFSVLFIISFILVL